MQKNTTKFKQTEQGPIPEDWEVLSISDVADVVGGGTPKTSEPSYWNGEIPWLSVVDFNNDSRKVYKTEKTITEEGVKNSSTEILKKGSLVISARGTVGALTQLGTDMAFNQSCYGLVAKSIPEDFLYYLVKNSVSDIQKRTHGSVFDTITRKTLDEVVIAVPKDQSEQKQIAEILSSLDDKIELNHKINKTLESIGQAIFKRWFVDEISEEWLKKKVVNFGKVVCGKTPPKLNNSYFGGTTPFIKIPDMHGQMFILKTEDSLTEEGKNFQHQKTLPAGSICASCIATVGIVSITTRESQTNQQINAIIPEKIFYTPFLYFQLKSLYEFLNNMGSGGSTTLNINTSQFSGIEIVYPPDQILEKFYNLVLPIFEQIKGNLFEIESLTQTRDLLLPRLMSGKIRVV